MTDRIVDRMPRRLIARTNDIEGARTAGLKALLLDPAGKRSIAERIGTLMEIFD